MSVTGAFSSDTSSQSQCEGTMELIDDKVVLLFLSYDRRTPLTTTAHNNNDEFSLATIQQGIKPVPRTCLMNHFVCMHVRSFTNQTKVVSLLRFAKHHTSAFTSFNVFMYLFYSKIYKKLAHGKKISNL